MNNRLQPLYESLKSSNLDAFLNNEIELDELWGKQIWGMFLIANLGEKVKAILSEHQSQLEELEPGIFSFPPPPAQHISINQVVHCLGSYELGNEKTWDSIKDSFLTSFKKLDQKYPKIDVTFSQLIATTGGIIWCAYDDDDEVENLRNELFNELPFPEETTKKVHFIHTTVARYKNKLTNPQKVLDYIANHQDKVSMTIDKIVLRNELMFPSMNFKDIAEIDLK